MKRPYPKEQPRFRFSASARDLPTYSLEEAEREVDRLTAEAEALRARSPTKVNAKAIWDRFNRRR